MDIYVNGTLVAGTGQPYREATHTVPGLTQLGVYRHGRRLWYVIEIPDTTHPDNHGILGIPLPTLREARAAARDRADWGGYR